MRSGVGVTVLVGERAGGREGGFRPGSCSRVGELADLTALAKMFLKSWTLRLSVSSFF